MHRMHISVTKVLGNTISFKSNIWAYLKSTTLQVKTNMTTLLVNFYSNIWTHWYVLSHLYEATFSPALNKLYNNGFKAITSYHFSHLSPTYNEHVTYFKVKVKVSSMACSPALLCVQVDSPVSCWCSKTWKRFEYIIIFYANDIVSKRISIWGRKIKNDSF